MEDQEYLVRLGKLVSNLLSLEFALRAFLLKHFESKEPEANISTVASGDVVPVNSFTNYDSLGRLIEKFNSVIESTHPNCCVDRSVVKIRDIIAHGRAASDLPKLPVRLVKFGKPNTEGMVLVEDVVTADLTWLGANVDHVLRQVHKVARASNLLGQNIMSYESAR